MGVLTKNEIVTYLAKDELLSNPRILEDGTFDVQPDSYDLTAGKAVWKEPDGKVSRPLLYHPDLSVEKQETHCLLPGEMVIVITHEEVLMPMELCGTVYTKNRLAMAGILALNAGHVDPGYHGPIVIRLINIRSEPWVLRMGSPIFSIIFQTLNEEASEGRPPITDKEMLERVEESAGNSMGNALYDLYALEVEKRLLTHQSVVEERLRAAMANDFIQRNDFWRFFFKSSIARIAAAVTAAAIVVGLILGILSLWERAQNVGSAEEKHKSAEWAIPAPVLSKEPIQRTIDRQQIIDEAGSDSYDDVYG